MGISAPSGYILGSLSVKVALRRAPAIGLVLVAVLGDPEDKKTRKNLNIG